MCLLSHWSRYSGFERSSTLKPCALLEPNLHLKLFISCSFKTWFVLILLLFIFLLQNRHSGLAAAVADPNTLLMWPGPGADDLRSYGAAQSRQVVSHTLIVLDGTWHQARGIFNQNAFLQTLKQVKNMFGFGRAADWVSFLTATVRQMTDVVWQMRVSNVKLLNPSLDIVPWPLDDLVLVVPFL